MVDGLVGTDGGEEGVAGGVHEKLPWVFTQVSSCWQESVPVTHSLISTARVMTQVKMQPPVPSTLTLAFSLCPRTSKSHLTCTYKALWEVYADGIHVTVVSSIILAFIHSCSYMCIIIIKIGPCHALYSSISRKIVTWRLVEPTNGRDLPSLTKNCEVMVPLQMYSPELAVLARAIWNTASARVAPLASARRVPSGPNRVTFTCPCSSGGTAELQSICRDSPLIGLVGVVVNLVSGDGTDKNNNHVNIRSRCNSDVRMTYHQL